MAKFAYSDKDIDWKRLEEIKKAIGYYENAEYRKKEVSIVKDKKQYAIRIPKEFADLAKVDSKSDVFEFELIPDKDEAYVFQLVGRLVKR